MSEATIVIALLSIAINCWTWWSMGQTEKSMNQVHATLVWLEDDGTVYSREYVS